MDIPMRWFDGKGKQIILAMCSLRLEKNLFLLVMKTKSTFSAKFSHIRCIRNLLENVFDIYVHFLLWRLCWMDVATFFYLLQSDKKMVITIIEIGFCSQHFFFQPSFPFLFKIKYYFNSYGVTGSPCSIIWKKSHYGI